MNSDAIKTRSSMLISRIHAREVLDSRGWPTVETEVTLRNGSLGRATVPAGASKGTNEAVELRDGNTKRYHGRGVLRAVENVNNIIGPGLCHRGMNASEQSRIDAFLCELDGTPSKSNLGANATLSVSIAVARAASLAMNQPLYRYLGGENACELPVPMVNIISGGIHAGGNLDMQDFQVIPLQADRYGMALEVVAAVREATSDLLKEKGYNTLTADEGGLGPSLSSNEDALRLLVEGTERAGFTSGRNGDVAFAVDVAATQLFRDGTYKLEREKRSLTTNQMIELLERWVKDYPIISIEDGLSEDDWDGWKTLTKCLGKRVQLIGDDLFTTNPRRVERGVQMGAANSVLVKMNQIGTLTETLEVIELSKKSNYLSVISARSGETEDSTLADLAVASGSGQVKIGSVTRSERLAKYNQLLRIEEELGSIATYRGRQVYAKLIDEP